MSAKIIIRPHSRNLKLGSTRIINGERCAVCGFTCTGKAIFKNAAGERIRTGRKTHTRYKVGERVRLVGLRDWELEGEIISIAPHVVARCTSRDPVFAGVGGIYRDNIRKQRSN